MGCYDAASDSNLDLRRNAMGNYQAEQQMINELCRILREQLKSGSTTSIKDLLARVDSSLRVRALRKLLETEFVFRLAAREPISLEPLLEQFPDCSDVIHEAYQSAQANLDPTTSLREGSDTAVDWGDRVATGYLDRSTVAGYEIQEELGRGGMGIVFKAYQPELDRTVALKIIRSADLAHESEIVRFSREAQAVAKLEHPHIVPIYEVGTDQQLHYFSMGYVEGETLDARMRREPLRRDAVTTVMLGICRGLGYAHQKGIVHRDIKPSNVMLDAKLSPRIMDFGLAKQLELDDKLTLTGHLVGTPAYMAPEQAAGSEVTSAVDIYAAGAVLYFMLTGRPPFRSDTVVDLLRQVQEVDPVEPRKLDPSIPLDLETICLKCLEKSPHHRYPSMEALAEELERFQQGIPIQARPSGTVERFRKWFVRNPVVGTLSTAVLVTLISLLGLAGYTSWVTAESNERLKTENQAKQAALQALAIEKQNLEKSRENERNARMASEIDREAAEVNLYALQLGNASDEVNRSNLGQALTVLDQTDPRRRGWADQHLRSIVDRAVFQWSATETEATVTSLTYAPDGKRLAGILEYQDSDNAKLRRKAIVVWNIEDEAISHRFEVANEDEPENVLFCPNSKELLTIQNDIEKIALEKLPDGSTVRRLVREQSPATIRVIDLETSEERFRKTFPSQLLDVVLTEQGDEPTAHMLCGDGQLRRCTLNDGATLDAGVLFPSAALAPTGFAASPFRKNAALNPSLQQAAIVTPSGLALYETGAVEKWNRPLGPSRTPTEAISLEFSASQNQIATLQLSTGRVRVYNTQDGSIHLASEITSGLGYALTISADGRRLIAGGLGGRVRVWNLSSGEHEHDLIGVREDVSSVAGSPDAKWAAVAEGGSVRIWDVESSQRYEQISRNGGAVNKLSFSDDNQLLAWACDQAVGENTIQVNVYNVLGQQLHRIDRKFRASVHAIAFRPNTHELAAGGGTGVVRFWNPIKDQELGTFNLNQAEHQYIVRGLEFNREGNRLAAAGWRYDRQGLQTMPEYVVAMTSPEDQAELWRLPFQEEIMAMKFTPDDQQLVLVRSVVASHTSRVTPDLGAFGIHGEIVRDPKLVISWHDAQTGKEARVVECKQPSLVAATLNDDCSRLATISLTQNEASETEQGYAVWDLASSQSVMNYTVQTENQFLPGVAFTPDGSRLVCSSTGTDKSVFMLDIASQTKVLDLAAFPNQPAPPSVLQFSPDGDYLALAGMTQDVNVLPAVESTAELRTARRQVQHELVSLYHGNLAPQLTRDNPHAAAFHYKKFLESRSNDEYRIRLAFLLAELERWQEASAQLDINQQLVTPEAAYWFCVTYLKSDRSDGYRSLMERQAKEVARMNDDQKLTFAWSGCLIPGLVSEMPALQQLANQWASEDPKRKDAKALLILSSLDIRRGNHDAALQRLENIVTITPRERPYLAWMMTALALIDKGKIEQARKAVTRAKAEYPSRTQEVISPQREFEKLQFYRMMQVPLTQAFPVIMRLSSEWQAARPVAEIYDSFAFAEIEILQREIESKLAEATNP